MAGYVIADDSSPLAAVLFGNPRREPVRRIDKALLETQERFLLSLMAYFFRVLTICKATIHEYYQLRCEKYYNKNYYHMVIRYSHDDNQYVTQYLADGNVLQLI